MKSFCAAFPAPDYYVSEQAVRDAVRTRFQFNVLHPTTCNKMDYFVAKNDEWGVVRLRRSRGTKLIPDRLVQTASPEDVIIGKLKYYAEGGSDKHLRDIAGILRISCSILDQDEVTRWATKHNTLDILQTVQQAVDDPNSPKV